MPFFFPPSLYMVPAIWLNSMGGPSGRRPQALLPALEKRLKSLIFPLTWQNHPPITAPTLLRAWLCEVVFYR